MLESKYAQKCQKRRKTFQRLLKKPIAPSKKSSPKICFVDSEAHQSKISCYLAKKNKTTLKQGLKYVKNSKNGPASKFWEFLAPLLAQVPKFFLLILTYI